MDSTRILVFLQALRERSVAGKLKWEATEEEDTFQTAFPEYALRVSKRVVSPDTWAPEYVVTIINDSGEVIEEITEDDLGGPQALVDEDVAARSLFRDIHQSARRVAMGVDKAVDDILSILQEG